MLSVYYVSGTIYIYHNIQIGPDTVFAYKQMDGVCGGGETWRMKMKTLKITPPRNLSKILQPAGTEVGLPAKF